MIFRLMKASDKLLTSMEKSWKRFPKAWKESRSRPSEKSVHNLRVNIRRLIAILELTQSISGEVGEIERLQRRFKKVLKRMGPLRDVQVQLKNISNVRASEAVGDFKRTLKRRERQEIEHVRKSLKPRRKRRLSKAIGASQEQLPRLRAKLDDTKVRGDVERLLELRRKEFEQARARFNPSVEETLHEMRIALKKLRYVVEAAQPVLGEWTKESARSMQAWQTLLGDTRDVAILQAGLEEWADRKGKKALKSIAPVSAQLKRERARLLKRITQSAAGFGDLRPLKESTLAPVQLGSREIAPATQGGDLERLNRS